MNDYELLHFVLSLTPAQFKKVKKLTRILVKDCGMSYADALTSLYKKHTEMVRAIRRVS